MKFFMKRCLDYPPAKPVTRSISGEMPASVYLNGQIKHQLPLSIDRPITAEQLSAFKAFKEFDLFFQPFRDKTHESKSATNRLSSANVSMAAKLAHQLCQQRNPA